MKIVSLVENTTNQNMKAVHGLSVYIELKDHKILFDLGPDNSVFSNAEKKGIDIKEIDTVIISHGHYDHGGALKAFLEKNKKAQVYIQESAFDDYYSKILFAKKYIGLDKKLKSNSRIRLLKGDYEIEEGLKLFTVKTEDKNPSEANAALLDKNGPDKFYHEQNLLIESDNKTVLITGCSHNGIVNILNNAAGIKPDVCIGGFHVYNPVSRKTVSQKQLDGILEGLSDYSDTAFYTCHCTGKKAFEYFSSKCNNIKYMACGDELNI